MNKQDLIKEIIQVADYFDKQGMEKEADVFDRIIKKLAWDPNEPDEGPADFGDASEKIINNLSVGDPIVDDSGKKVGEVTYINEDSVTGYGHASGNAIDPPEVDTDNLVIGVRVDDVHNEDIDDIVNEFIYENVSGYEDKEPVVKKGIGANEWTYTFSGGVTGRRGATYERPSWARRRY